MLKGVGSDTDEERGLQDSDEADEVTLTGGIELSRRVLQRAPRDGVRSPQSVGRKSLLWGVWGEWSVAERWRL